MLPFELTSAPATLQRLMECVMHSLHWRTLLLYLEDIIVIAPNFVTHLHWLEKVFQRLHKAGLKLKPSKCKLFQSQVGYLGHIVSQNGVSTDPDQVEAVAKWPSPPGVRELQGFFRTVSYYRQYIPDFATVAHPLHSMIAKREPWRWTEGEQAAFNPLKESIMTALILGCPDHRRQYILDTDASRCGVGAALSQV